MTIDRQKLRGKMVEKNITAIKLSEKMGIDKSTFYRKIKGGDTFEIGEVHKMCEALSLSKDEAISIFLPKYSH